MAVQPGTKLGPYEIVSPLGAGGMGEVYKATDTRLNRTVAIKVLPPQFMHTPEMKQRFDREAQVIAGLNHPNICTLFDIGREGDTDFLVMEYLEGETLAARIAAGALPLDEALKVAIQIADALDKAHGQGITHRDLKPGNVMLTAKGAKLLDFGLAKLQAPAQAAAAGAMFVSGVSLNTTAPGMIIGTMQYMAPEQLEGKDADARTDIFAFGAVLYEMITGRKAFEGKSQPHLIAAIVSSQPDPASKTQPQTPPALDFLIKRCLAKDPDERLQTATDLVAELQWIADGGEGDAPVPVVAARKSRPRAAHVALAIVTVVAVALGVLAFGVPKRTGVAEETRFLIAVPDMPVGEAVSISPDGRQVAYSANDGGSSSVFVRPINVEVPQKLAGTEGAGRLFWSSDSKWIAFFAGGKLKKVEAAGGPPQNICETPDLAGGTWNSDGIILFASSKGLERVLAAGGEPSPVAASGGSPREPYFLPDGHHYLYLSGKDAAAAIYVSTLESKDATKLVTALSGAVYAEAPSTGSGYLLYHREGTLYAQPFSARKLSFTGEAMRIADRLPYAPTGAAPFAASNTDVLLYRNDPESQAGTASTIANNIPARPLRWVPRKGSGEQAAAPAGWAGPDLSPDGKRAAIHRHDPDGGDIWIFTIGQTTPSKFTFDASQDNSSPVWSPDGTRIAFASQRNGKYGLYMKAADNTRNEELIIEAATPMTPMSWSGDRLVYWMSDPKTAGDIWMVALAGDRKPVPIVHTQADERNPQVSPDGKWLAYSSNESGRSEIYIRPFPEGPAKIQVSVNGGLFPRWRRDGKELYFMSLVSLGAMMAADIRVSSGSIERDVPHALFQSVYLNSGHAGGQYNAYAVSADGQRFLIPQFESLTAFGRGRGGVIAAVTAALPAVSADRHTATASTAQATAPITVVLDWTAALAKSRR
jgi:Tol biopolymer transport system component/tRNA A-37 threonylcarbamoyl transferase component Bud32